MLLNFKVNNFCSFKNEFNFSMKPGKVVGRFEDNVIKIGEKAKVSKVAVVVGENAGGKTCFMKSLSFFKHIIDSNANVRSLKRLCYDYNLKESQKFELIALIEKKIYTYSLEIDKKSIKSEKLEVRNYLAKQSKNKIVFINEREKVVKIDPKEYSIQMKCGIDREFINNNNNPFIKLNEKDDVELEFEGMGICYFNNIGVDIVKPLLKWIKEKLIIEMPSALSMNWYRKMEKDEEDLEILASKEFLEIFMLIDTSITHIKVDKKDPYQDTEITRKKEDGSSFKIKLKDDSSGVNEFFAWSVQIWRVIYRDVTLLADEMDRVLNPILASRVFNFIKGTDHKGQFIFSTHNVLHINTIDFMKEQIYFVNKDKENLSSEMYCLADFKEYRYDKANVYELYINGFLGGTPNE